MTEPPNTVKDVETVERVIDAPPETIFAFLVDPRKHREIDGSGTVRDAKGEPQQLQLGSTFGMSMKMGFPYSMVSTVIEYEENRRIAWQTHGPTAIGKYVGGRIWRYELEPVDGGTRVRESWDIRQESAATRPIVRKGAEKTRKDMAATLERIDQLVTG
jgi:uncharacterized protein YndB with AHSA1/START domain